LKKFWAFLAKSTKKGELTLYGDISSASWWGDEVTPKQFKADMDALGEIDELDIYINSGGGDVFAGQAIYSILKRKNATKTVYVDGLAASIASVIAMAGDKIVIPRNAMMMIHNPYTFTAGNSEELRKMADDLDKIRESIVNTYEDKTGLEREKIIELMDNETWMTADEASGYGFCDEIGEEKQIAASIGGFFMSKYKNLPENLKNEVPVVDPNEKNTNDLDIPVDGLFEIYQAKIKNNLRRSQNI
jgi:ATP-dependent Clp protease protease subunit